MEGIMKTKLMQRLGRRDEEGFTLIELMVVVLIIAILMAIAIPTFLSARGNAQAKAAESNIRNAITDEQTYFTGAGNGANYGAASDLVSNSVDNALSFVSVLPSTPTPSDIVVTYSSTTPTEVQLMAEGSDHNYYYAFDDNGAVTYYVSSVATDTGPFTNTTWPSTVASS
jgi:type IV pilus assembly protein PilA